MPRAMVLRGFVAQTAIDTDKTAIVQTGADLSLFEYILPVYMRLTLDFASIAFVATERCSIEMLGSTSGIGIKYQSGNDAQVNNGGIYEWTTTGVIPPLYEDSMTIKIRSAGAMSTLNVYYEMYYSIEKGTELALVQYNEIYG